MTSNWRRGTLGLVYVLERLASNRAGVWERIDGALRACGRPPGSVRLVCVTKSVAPDVAAALFETGERDFGENRIDELERKKAHFDAHGLEVRWHWLGHIQGRKARRVLRAAHTIHSLDSEALFERLEQLGQEEELHPELFLQVKLAPEEEKTGLDPHAVAALAEDGGGRHLGCGGDAQPRDRRAQLCVDTSERG